MKSWEGIIVFIDRDGTVMPESPQMSLLRHFHQGPYKPARSYLGRLVQGYGARLVWNSRNPDPEEFARRTGRLHSMNTRRYADPSAEHIELLKSAGIEQEWFFPEYPEVVHHNGISKGQSMMGWLSKRAIPVERSIAFDNSPQELYGYPDDRIIGVSAAMGIIRPDYLQALKILGLDIEGMDMSSKTGPAETSPQKTPQPQVR